MLEPLDLLDQADRIDDHAVADDALLAGPEDAGGHEVQDELLAADEDGVAGVVAAGGADHEVGALRQHVDDLALAFVAPLGADEDGIGHRGWRAVRRRVPPRGGPGARWWEP